METMMVRKGDLVFDIGASLGNYITAFRGCGARVVAVEPQSKIFDMLLKQWLPDKDVHLVHAACGSVMGTSIIHICEQAHTVSTMNPIWKEGRFKDYAWGNTETVTVITLDHLIDIYGMPTFIKIDVEGFEQEVLRGLSKAVQTIVFEYTAETPQYLQECLSLLDKLGNYEYSAIVNHDFYLRIPFIDSDGIFKWFSKEVLSIDLLHGDIVARIKKE